MKRPAWCEHFLEAIRSGHGPCRAAELAGRDKSTPYSLARTNARFAADWKAAQEEANERDRARFARKLRAANESAGIASPPKLSQPRAS